jgi:hypothetical protein
MGAGASIDNNSNEGNLNFFCHSCRHAFIMNQSNPSVDHYCPRCQSTFLEQVSASSHFHNFVELSEDQSRRLANASMMLRLLEVQLRDELEHLQMAYLNINSEQAASKKPMTALMKEKLRHPIMSVDMICSQPSCPICSEEFILGNKELQMPCSHLFHEACVMPWLDMHRTCPICRYEMTENVQTIEELERFSIEEIKEKLSKFDVVSAELCEKSK